MAGSNQDQPPSVWFIDNRLTEAHPLFNDAPVHYDPTMQQYVANNLSAGVIQNGGTSNPDSLGMNQRPPPRPEWTDLKAMTFWDGMFSAAMEKFTSTVEVQKRRAEQYIIHRASDWEAVYTMLELARDQYKDKGGSVRWWRKVRRKAADNVAPLQRLTKVASNVAPENPYSTPVLGAVGMLLDAAMQASTVRKQVSETFGGERFENLIPIFSDVELFLGEMFNKDPHIYNASLELTVTALKAVDRTIGFYTSNEFSRGGKAIAMGGDYQKELVESINDISTKSAKLLEEAKKSHMHESQFYSEQGRRMMANIQTEVVTNQAITVAGFNHMNNLLVCHIAEKDRDLKEKDRQLAAAHEKEVRLMVEIERLRSTSPAMPALAYAPPVPALMQAPAPVPVPFLSQNPYLSQEALETMLGMANVDFDDMDYIFSKELQFPARERLQIEQIIQQQLFANWVVSPSSSKLLVQWESPRPRTIADLSPLSLFCTKLAQMLAPQGRFLSIQWFCGRHLRSNSDPSGGGGHAMLMSMISQLLRGHRDGFNMAALSHNFDIPSLLQARDNESLIRLLEWLVRALPRSLTLFCLVDGVVLYERQEHWDAAWPVLACLLRMADDPAIEATVKVLFTSTPGPPTVRSAFEDERLILNVETLQNLAVAPSNERFARELGQELGDG
ncbi:hypothetical protein PGQ11_009943 [Apiospora arundinis]|uniref:Uncharacterized protein n=1 Tax=Apiospora arundinis TaxID=335852 RepID=A0ABR2I858_9PEZI